MSLALLVFIKKRLIATISIKKMIFAEKFFFAIFGPLLATPGVPHFLALGANIANRLGRASNLGKKLWFFSNSFPSSNTLNNFYIPFRDT